MAWWDTDVLPVGTKVEITSLESKNLGDLSENYVGPVGGIAYIWGYYEFSAGVYYLSKDKPISSVPVSSLNCGRLGVNFRRV